jgi:glycosyltransferase involved in cell wall biosynthesis
MVGKYIDKWRWWTASRRLFAQQVARHGKPDIIHAHVSWPAGWLARQLSILYGIPYGIREHWTVFLPEDKNRLGGIALRLAGKAFHDAAFVSPDAARLGQYIAPYSQVTPVHIPNVVDTTMFCPAPEPANNYLLHVSTLNDMQKNITGLLQAFAQLYAHHPDARLVMVGHDVRESYIDMCGQLAIQDVVTWTGSLPPDQVANHMQQAKGLVLFSRAENAPVVISEALCCGLPVIATTVGGIKDMVSEKDGQLIASEDVSALTKAMEFLWKNTKQYNRTDIAHRASLVYSAEAVRQRWLSVYSSLDPTIS